MTETDKEIREANKRRKLISVLSFVVLIAFFALVAYYVGKPMIKMIRDKDAFHDWIDAKGFLGKLIMIGMMALQVIVAIIPGEPLEIGAGYAFGAIEGAILCMLGAAIGSAVIFLFVKTFGMKMVEAFVPKEKIDEIAFIRDSKRLDLLVFFLFLIPGTPKDVITYFIGVTPMKLLTFLWITSLARIPSVVSSTMGGSSLGNERYLAAIIIFAVTGVISLAGLWYYKKRFGRKKSGEAKDV